jgi:hypothetical protein
MISALLKTSVRSLFVMLTVLSITWATDRIYPTQYSSIQSAIDAANDGDNIVLNDYFTGSIVINKNITITGNNNPHITATSSIEISADHSAYITGVIIGATGYNSAITIRKGGALTLDNCIVYGDLYNGNGGSNWAIDDYGSNGLELDNTNFIYFNTIVDALNCYRISFLNCSAYSNGMIANSYGYETRGDNAISYQYGYFLCPSNALRLQDSGNSSDCLIYIRETWADAGGYPVVADGPTVAVMLSNSHFNTCENNTWSLLNGASLISNYENTFCGNY